MHDKPGFREAVGFEAQGLVPGGTQRRYRNWLRRYDPAAARRKSCGRDLLGRIGSERTQKGRSDREREPIPGGSAKKGNRNQGIQGRLFSAHVGRDQGLLRGARGKIPPEPGSYALSRRSPSRPSAGIRIDLEYVPKPHDPGIRNCEVRRRPWSAQFFCPVGRAHCPQENSNDPGLLQDPERQGLVYRGYLFFDSEAAWRRVKFARKVCGSILRTKDGLLKTVTDWRATTNPAAA